MKWQVVVRVGAPFLILALSAATSLAAGARARTWQRAAALAKPQNRVIFAIYSEGSAREASIGHALPADFVAFLVAQNDEDVRFEGAPNVSQSLRHVKVREITEKYCLIAQLRMADPGSMWDKFSPNMGYKDDDHMRCVFATWKGEYLNRLSDQARPGDFIAAWNVAYERYTEILKNDPEYQKMMQKKQELAAQKELADQAEEALKSQDYATAMAKAGELLDLTADTTAEGRRAKTVKRRISAMAQAGCKRCDTHLKGGKPLDAFRELDEVIHLFAGAEEANEAEKRLDELMARQEYAEAAEKYRPERQAYDLWEEAWDYEHSQRWQDALTKYKRIIEDFADSLVAKRAAERAKTCEVEVKKEAAKAAGDAKT